MLRVDCAMNFSPEVYEEFIEPCDRRLLDEFGGSVHFCGKGDHYIHRIAHLPRPLVVNVAQPEYNDMEVIFQHTIDKGIAVLALPRWAGDAALAGGRDLRGKVHCR